MALPGILSRRSIHYRNLPISLSTHAQVWAARHDAGRPVRVAAATPGDRGFVVPWSGGNIRAPARFFEGREP
ncbi:hypothetical protein KL86PLE_100162 [uncultured Pleomorphomonas sp.]|uniref:Uncharacterized protein n=1 Tax=uncultured Pleomorphomonas sp. TaxID=442121 RepID=A0A212L1K1_9HYPH|nr:hypothetical protein KL86PLE_100162 [uncultured Pleomorphomonas sp.]